jgi:DNA-binding GntR family transcriptional regulator
MGSAVSPDQAPRLTSPGPDELPLARLAAVRIDRKKSAAPQVYDLLRGLIISLAAPPGANLPRAQIAERLGLSLTPVREALLRLEEEELVDIHPQSATRVSQIGLQRAREAHFLRLSVELEVVRRVAAAPERTDLGRLRATIRRQEDCLAAGDMGGFIAADHAFHHNLHELAGVPGLWQVIRTRSGQLDRLRHLHLPTPGKTQSVIDEHKRILKAIAAGKAGDAQRALRAHLSGTLASAELLRRRHPSYIRD